MKKEQFKFYQLLLPPDRFVVGARQNLMIKCHSSGIALSHFIRLTSFLTSAMVMCLWTHMSFHMAISIYRRVCMHTSIHSPHIHMSSYSNTIHVHTHIHMHIIHVCVWLNGHVLIYTHVCTYTHYMHKHMQTGYTE